MSFSTGNKHIDGCAQTEKMPCFNGLVLRGTNQHRWSGWPGAYCLDCHAEDKDEVCLGTSCRCPCHAEFWAAYSEDSSSGVTDETQDNHSTTEGSS